MADILRIWIVVQGFRPWSCPAYAQSPERRENGTLLALVKLCVAGRGCTPALLSVGVRSPLQRSTNTGSTRLNGKPNQTLFLALTSKRGCSLSSSHFPSPSDRAAINVFIMPPSSPSIYAVNTLCALMSRRVSLDTVRPPQHPPIRCPLGLEHLPASELRRRNEQELWNITALHFSPSLPTVSSRSAASI